MRRLILTFSIAFSSIAAATPTAAPDTATFQLTSWPPADADSARARLQDTTDALLDYVRVRPTGLAGWDDSGGLYVETREAGHPFLYRVARPLGPRRRVQSFDKRVASFHLSPTGTRLLFAQDEGGNEQFRVSVLDLRTLYVTPAACPPGRVDDILWDDSGKVFVYAHTPEGTDRWDIRLGTPEGRDSLLYGAPGTWMPMDLSPDRKRLLLQKYVSASEAQLYLLENGKVTRLLPQEPPQSIAQALWLSDSSVCFLSDRGGEFARLYALTLATGRVDTLSAPARWDVEWVSASRDRMTLVYSLNEDGLSRLYARSTGARGKPRALSDLPSGLIDGAVFKPGSREFAFTLNSATSPGDVWTYDLGAGKPRRWTRTETGKLSFREPKLVHFQSDSLSIPAWVYRPAPGPRPHRLPVLVQIHGGPESQARPGFDAFVQYAVSRGLAVVIPNVRGSSGYGRAYQTADDGRKRPGAVRDIGSLLDWIKTQRDLDPQRVAVAGRSYGGFMSLASLYAYGERFKAGVSTVGITHFPTFLKNTSGYRRDLRRVEYGDERDSAMAVFLDSISPLTNLDKIKSPLLLCHGKNDPRVPFAESERIFDALKARSVPVWFLSFRDEGHAFRDEASRAAHYRVMADFLGRYLAF